MDRVQFSAIGEYFDGSPPDVSLQNILAIGDKDLKQFSRELLKIDDSQTGVSDLLAELAGGVRAYFQFQDILAVSIEIDTLPWFNRHYCYYESLVYLRESIVSWLDRNVLAALTLLRPFLELSVFHLYWYLRCEDKHYKPYYDWLKGEKGKPPFANALNYVFDTLPAREWVEDKRLHELKQVIRHLYKGLCAYNHTPKMDESIAAKSGGLGNIAYETFYFAVYITNMLLRQIIYLFMLVYPMCMFPVEGYKKWGFSGPLGLFFDKCNFAILEAYIGSENVAVLKQSLSCVPKVKSLIEWFDEIPTLSDDEIEADWQRFRRDSHMQKENDHLPQRLAICKSHSRALGWFMNYMMEPPPDDGVPEEIYKLAERRMKNW